MTRQTAGVRAPARLQAVQASGLLDTGPEAAFDRLAELAAELLEAPLAFVTIVDDTRSFWKACMGPAAGGLTVRENAVGDSFCQYVIDLQAPLIVGDTAADPRTRDNPSIASMGVAAWAGFPVHSPDGEVLGSFCVVDTEVRQWTRRDERVLRTLSQAASGELALRDVLARSQAQSQVLLEQAERSTALARTLSDSLLPPLMPDVPGLQVAARHLPAGQGAAVLGDFYDVFQTGRNRWTVALGDVSGHGVQAAKVTALARWTIRAAAREHTSPREVLELLNEAMLNAQPPESETFLTVACLSVRQARGRVSVTLANAGHTPVLLRRADGSVIEVGAHGMFLGAFEEPQLTDHRVALLPGDALVLYTDGITEARRGTELFGDARLRDVLSQAAGLGAAEVTAAIEAAAVEFADGPTSDDIAVLVLRVPVA